MNRVGSIAIRRSALLILQQREAVRAFQSPVTAAVTNFSSVFHGASMLSRCRFFASDASSSSSSLESTTSIPPTNAPPTSTVAAAAEAETKATTTIREPTTTNENVNLLASGRVQRHGKGDAVITLNVGGKEFCTLRSTVAANSVLTQHVSRAEQNSELTYGKGGNCAVFIDRDPTHFALILNHLRNKVEGLSYYNRSAAKKSTSLLRTTMGSSSSSSEHYVQLPKEIDVLRDIYLEAQHYQISELQAASCEQNAIVTIIGAIEGKHGGNPFDKLTKISQLIRRGFVAIGSLGTLAIGSQQDHNKWLSQLFPSWFPEDSDKEERNPNIIIDGDKSNHKSKSLPSIA